jgi:hypothetical protein
MAVDGKPEERGASPRKATMSVLFTPEPEQWGLRGDPGVWQAMKEHLASVPVPDSSADVERLLTNSFHAVVGVDITTDRQHDDDHHVYLEQFARGGMSSGVIDVHTWRDRLLPLLAARAASTATPPLDRPSAPQAGRQPTNFTRAKR